MATYKEFHQYSIEKPDAFWTEQAQLIDWKEPFSQVCDYSRPPFAKWFVGGKTNLCHNAVDRHAAKRPNDRALIFVSTETNEETVYSFAELQREIERMAAIYQSLGVKRGDRVLIYMPMIAQACLPSWPRPVSAPFTRWCSAVSPPVRWLPASTTPSRY
jgi:propionyl-CoA synthetase